MQRIPCQLSVLETKGTGKAQQSIPCGLGFVQHILHSAFFLTGVRRAVAYSSPYPFPCCASQASQPLVSKSWGKGWALVRYIYKVFFEFYTMVFHFKNNRSDLKETTSGGLVEVETTF